VTTPRSVNAATPRERTERGWTGPASSR